MKIPFKTAVALPVLLLTLACTNAFATSHGTHTPSAEIHTPGKYVFALRVGPCDSIPAWSPVIAYTGGTIVKYNGKIYRCNWWNQGETPDTHTGPGSSWTWIGDC